MTSRKFGSFLTPLSPLTLCDKIHLEQNFFSNHIQIDFFDPILAVRSTCRNDSIRTRIIIISKNSIYIKKNQNTSNSIKFFDINQLFLIKIYFYEHLIDYFDPLMDFFNL